MKKILNLVFFFLLIPVIYLGSVAAADVNVKVTRNYYIDDAEKVKVVENHTIENHHKTMAVSDANSERFSINVTAGNIDALKKSVESLVVLIDGKKVNFTTEMHDDYALIDVKMPTHISPGKKMSFQIEYTNYGLMEKKGALLDFYASGYKKNATGQTAAQANTLVTEYSFDTFVSVAKSLPATNFVVPDLHDVADSTTYTRYYFSHDSLIDKYIWIQIGRTQFYKFTITQNVTSTDLSSSTYQNEYRLIVPRDIDEPLVYQKVYFTNISPMPSYADQDSNGNLILGFKRPTDENSIITVEGYAEVGRSAGEVTADTSGGISELNLPNIESYLVSDTYSNKKTKAQYWQIDDNQIKSLVGQQFSGEDNVFKLSEKIYNFIITKIDYSKIKRFGINERQGAVKTLSSGAGVCMEYADLYLTLSRAAGIPTRAVFGYGYDSKIQNDKQEAHQWVQVYMPKLEKWVSVDVTWGESGMKMAEGSLNHFFTHVTSTNPNEPAIVERKTFGSGSTLETPQYTIQAVDQAVTPEAGARTQFALLNEYPKPPEPTNELPTIITLIKGVNVSTVMIVVGVLLMFVSVIGIIRMGREDTN